MAAPWAIPPVYGDYYAAANILAGLASGDLSIAEDDCKAVSPGTFTAIPAGVDVPLAILYEAADYVLVGIGGTRNWLQWILHFMGSALTPFSDLEGKVNAYFHAAAGSLRDALSAIVIPQLTKKKLVLIGHSFGGAIAQLLGTFWQGQADNGICCITFGSPRVGDPTFAASVGFGVERIQDTADPVPSFPPEQWLGIGTPWGPWPDIALGTYQHAGNVHSLAQDGTITSVDNTMPFQDSVGAIADQAFDPHTIQEYLFRLSQRLLKEPDQPLWADPPALHDNGEFLINLFFPFVGGNAVAGSLTQGIMYFKTSEQIAGWGESWVGGQDITTMLDLLQTLAKTRAYALAGNCSIHAVKASDITVGRLTNSSRTIRLDTPIVGKSSNIKDLEQVQTNETMDAIDYQLKSTTNASSRIYPFRGVPDEWIAGSVRSDKGRDGSKKIENYLTAVKGASLGFKIYDRTKPKKAIQSIAIDAASGLLLIQAPAHGIDPAIPNQLVTVRGFTPNRMINGKWKVGVKDANSFFLVGSQRFQADATNVGTWQLYNLVADSIGDFFFNQVSVRRTGRPFGALRGKRGVKLLHH